MAKALLQYLTTHIEGERKPHRDTQERRETVPGRIYLATIDRTGNSFNADTLGLCEYSAPATLITERKAIRDAVNRMFPNTGIVPSQSEIARYNRGSNYNLWDFGSITIIGYEDEQGKRTEIPGVDNIWDNQWQKIHPSVAKCLEQPDKLRYMEGRKWEVSGPRGSIFYSVQKAPGSEIRYLVNPGSDIPILAGDARQVLGYINKTSNGYQYNSGCITPKSY